MSPRSCSLRDRSERSRLRAPGEPRETTGPADIAAPELQVNYKPFTADTLAPEIRASAEMRARTCCDPFRAEPTRGEVDLTDSHRPRHLDTDLPRGQLPQTAPRRVPPR